MGIGIKLNEKVVIKKYKKTPADWVRAMRKYMGRTGTVFLIMGANIIVKFSNGKKFIFKRSNLERSAKVTRRTKIKYR